ALGTRLGGLRLVGLRGIALAGILCRILLRCGLAPLLITAGHRANDAANRADDAADRATEHAADRAGGLVAFARALLDPLAPLCMERPGQTCDRCPHRQHDDGPDNKTQPQSPARDRIRADHYLVSMTEMADAEPLAGIFGACRISSPERIRPPPTR